MWCRAYCSTVLMTVLALAAVACGAQDVASREVEDVAEPAAGPFRPQLEIPTGHDPAAVEPHVAELLRSYDRVVNSIYADAAAVDDPDHDLLDELRTLFAPDSEQVAFLVEGWVQEDGSREQDEGAHFLNTELRSVDSESEASVSFVTCVETRLFLPDGASGGDRAVGYEFRAGHGRAVRVGEEWLLDEVSIGQAGLCNGGGV